VRRCNKTGGLEGFEGSGDLGPCFVGPPGNNGGGAGPHRGVGWLPTRTGTGGVKPFLCYRPSLLLSSFIVLV